MCGLLLALAIVADVPSENVVVERELTAGRPLVLRLKQHDIAARWTALGNPALPWTEGQGAFTARPDANPPILAFVSAADLNRITVAADDLAHPLKVNGYLKYESGAEIEISVAYPPGVSNRTSRVRIDTRAVPYWQSVREAAAWMMRANPLEPSPEAAFDPLWNSWYAYRTGITADVMEREGKAAADLGLKNVIYDMGWDREGDVHSISFRPCGDWLPSERNFPDIRSHFARMHALGLKALVWFGYPLVGTESKIYDRAKAWCLNQTPDRRGTLTLDPRREEALEHVRTRMEALAELGADGYKVDFIQTFGAYGAPDAAVMDFQRRLKASLDQKFTALGKAPPLIEYMNIYGGPGNLAFATQVRASDCPGDAAENRMRTARLRLLSGPKAVHCDMVTWDDAETPGRAAVQLISVLHSVIQVGRSVATLPADHRRMLTNWLGFASAHRDTLLKGEFRPHGVVSGIVRTEMESAVERIVAVHAPETVVPVTVDKTVCLLNGSPADAVVVELNAPVEAELVNVFGETVGHRHLPKGLVRIDGLLTGSRAVLNGVELKEPFVRHADIVKGGVLLFEMKTGN